MFELKDNCIEMTKEFPPNMSLKKALDLSIEAWEVRTRIDYRADYENFPGSALCALCELYHAGGCGGCPAAGDCGIGEEEYCVDGLYIVYLDHPTRANAHKVLKRLKEYRAALR